MMQAKPGRSGKQQQEISPNLGTAFQPSPVIYAVAVTTGWQNEPYIEDVSQSFDEMLSIASLSPARRAGTISQFHNFWPPFYVYGSICRLALVTSSGFDKSWLLTFEKLSL